jgi:hypothetical protein
MGLNDTGSRGTDNVFFWVTKNIFIFAIKSVSGVSGVSNDFQQQL